jgi:hypothetical protein
MINHKDNRNKLKQTKIQMIIMIGPTNFRLFLVTFYITGRLNSK